MTFSSCVFSEEQVLLGLFFFPSLDEKEILLFIVGMAVVTPRQDLYLI